MNNHTPSAEQAALDLDAISARAADAQQYGIEDDGFEQLVREDVPALVAEVRRLRAAVLPPPVSRADALDRIREVVRRLAAHAVGFQDVLDESDRGPWGKTVAADIAELRRMIDETPVTPPPALTEEGRLRMRVNVLEDDAERMQGFAKIGARCMRDHHDGQLAGARVKMDGWRFALAVALGLDTEKTPWDAIHERVKELRRRADEAQPDPGFVPPAAAGLPAGTLEAAEIGANRLDAWARTPQGRNFLAHALVQLARTGWLRTEPGEGFEPVPDRDDAPAPVEPAAEAHSCRNCEGTDPDTCLMNPDRATGQPAGPATDDEARP